jgi:hypothetical protein
MRETKQKQIGDRGHVYHVTQFGARHGGRVLVRLLKMIGGAAGEALKSEGEFDMQAVGNVVANLAESVSENDFDFLCDTFAKTTSVEIEGKTIPLTTEGIFDLHFAGAYVELGQWLLFAVEVNFGGFLDAGGIVRTAAAAANDRRVSVEASKGAESQSISPTT